MDYSIYVLEIQEVEGKNIVENCLREVIQKCEELNLYCIIEIMGEESVKLGLMSGGASTFPYSVFESLVDNITQTKEMNQIERRGFFDRMFSFFRQEPSGAVETARPVETTSLVEKKIDKSVLEQLKNKTEIVRVKIEIEEETEQMNRIGGLYELECRLFQ